MFFNGFIKIETNSEIVQAIISVSATLVIIIVMFILIASAFINKNKKLQLENDLQKKQFQQTLLQSQVEIHEQTLKTISQEIHDNIGQVLSLAKLTIASIESNNNIIDEKVSTSNALLNKAIVDLKDISKSLNTDLIESIGLLTAIENEVDVLNKTNLKGFIEVNGIVTKLDAKTELILFRIVQECLNNAIKHSNANKIEIIIEYNSTNVLVVINDNGIGFNFDDNFKKGLGLSNMQNRVRLINGTLNISNSNKGTTVNILVNF